MCILQTRGWFTDAFDKIKDTAKEIGGKIEDTAKEFGGKIENAADKVSDAFKEAFNEVKSSVFLAKLKTTFGRYWTAIEPRLEDILKPCAKSLIKEFGKVNKIGLYLNV